MRTGRQFVRLAIALALAACGSAVSAPAATQQAQATEAPEATLQSLPAAAEDAQAAPPATFSGQDCLSVGGRVEIVEIESAFMTGGILHARIYTPPCYAEQDQREFPTLYLFHGQTYGDDQWDRLGVDEVADALISAGELAPFLIVMPYYSSSQQPSVNPFETAVLEELLPWVQDSYRVLGERDYRAIGGLSMGASWALHFGMRHPTLFGAMGGHSPPVFVEDASQVRGWLAEIPDDQMPRIWLDIGDHDQAAILASAQWLESLLTGLGIPHEWHLFAGRHEEAYWRRHVGTYLRWYAAGW